MKKTSTTAATKKKPVQENKSAATDKKVAAPKKTQSKVVEEVKKVEPVVVEKSLGDTLISELGEKIVSVQGELKSMQQTLKLLVKEYEKQKKVIAKVQKKRENAKKSPSGFAKPCKISSELCKFVGVPEGTEKSRTDITRYINAYVKEKNLNKWNHKKECYTDFL